MRFLTITSFGFDDKGMAYPRRVSWRGRDIWLEAPVQRIYVPFALGNTYYWLVRRHGSWQLLND